MRETAWVGALAERGIFDEHAHYYSGTGLLAALRQPHVEYPCFRWATSGRNLHAIAATFGKKLAVGFDSVGFCGFCAGPDVWIVDYFALGDPLLARLPPIPDPFWRVGHFLRRPGRLSCDPAERQERPCGSWAGGLLRSTCDNHAGTPLGPAPAGRYLGHESRPIRPAAGTLRDGEFVT